jgi:hypothetical protein
VAALASMPAERLHAAGNSYFGLLGQSDSSHHDRARIAKALLRRGHVVNGQLAKTYRRAA